jgi:hypothetical protein
MPDFAVFPVLLFHDTPGDSDILWNVLDGDDDLIRFLRSDPPWCVTSPLWRRDALERIGGFNERVFYGDDAELHTRAILNGLRHEKHAGAQPDCFIRRSETPRITSGMRPETVASRRTRLAEMQKLIDNADISHEARLTWQGEYVAEAEFLLFNHPEPRPFVRDILADMKQHAGMSNWQQTAVRTYFTIALVTRDRAYILLRLARNMLRLLVPRAWLERDKTFCKIRKAEMLRC